MNNPYVVMAMLTICCIGATSIDRREDGDVVHYAKTCSNNRWERHSQNYWLCLCIKGETVIHDLLNSQVICSRTDQLEKTSANHGDISSIAQEYETQLKLDTLKKLKCAIQSASVWNSNGTVGSWDLTWSSELVSKMDHNTNSAKLTISMASSENWQGLLLKIDLQCPNAVRYSTLIKVQGLRSYPITSPLLSKQGGNTTPTTAATIPFTSAATSPTTSATPSTTDFQTTKEPSTPSPSASTAKSTTRSARQESSDFPTGKDPTRATLNTRNYKTTATLPDASKDMQTKTGEVGASLIFGLGIGCGALIVLVVTVLVLMIVKRKRRAKKDCDEDGDQGPGSKGYHHHATKLEKMIKGNKPCKPCKPKAGKIHSPAWTNPAYDQDVGEKTTCHIYQVTDSADHDATYTALNSSGVYAHYAKAEPSPLQEQTYTTLDYGNSSAHSAFGDSFYTGSKAANPASQILPRPNKKDTVKAGKRSVNQRADTEPPCLKEERYTAIPSVTESVYYTCEQNREPETNPTNGRGFQDGGDTYQALNTNVTHKDNIYITPESKNKGSTKSLTPRDHDHRPKVITEKKHVLKDSRPMPPSNIHDFPMAVKESTGTTQWTGTEPHLEKEGTYTAITTINKSDYSNLEQDRRLDARQSTERGLQAGSDTYQELSTAQIQDESVYIMPESKNETCTIYPKPTDHKGRTNFAHKNEASKVINANDEPTNSGCSAIDEEPDYKELDWE